MKKSAPNADVRRFRQIADAFLERGHELFPHQASELGLLQFEGDLGQNDDATFRTYGHVLTESLRAVEALPETAFRGDDWLDRRMFLSMLRTGSFDHDARALWRTNPQLHCDAAIQAIFGPVVRNAENLARALPAVQSRLAKLPDFLAASASCVRKPVPLWTKLATQTCEGAQLFLVGLKAELCAVSKQPAMIAKLIAGASAAFADYARAINRREPGASNGFAIGRDAFEFMIREKIGLSWSVAETEALGHRLIAQLRQELKTEAAKFGKRKASELIESAAQEWTPNGTLLAEYARVTADVRARFAQADLLTLPAGERLKVLPVPEFLRHQFPTAAYHSPGPFAKDQTGIFWVNDLSAQQSDPVRRRAEIEQHFGMELTCAHEGYPGHHVQFVIQNRHPSKLRRLASHAIFYEGWTLWCEKMCVDFGIFDSPCARLIQLSDALWRAHRIVIDCGLQTGTMSPTAAAKFLVEGVGFTRSRAEGDIHWYSSAPTVPMSYLLGRLELEKLHARLVLRDGWSVKRFNDWILSHGAIPWSWIWQAELQSAPI